MSRTYIEALLSPPLTKEECEEIYTLAAKRGEREGHTIALLVRDAIAAWNRRAGGEREAWLPISTAPVDGTKIDVWIGRDKHRITDVYWSNIQGWWCIDGHYGPEEPTPLAIIPAPSHWQPLSAPPRAALAGQTGGERNGG